MALGYWNDPERTAERFRPVPGRDSAWRTPELAVWSGDTVVADEDGFLYFVGRKDEMIKTSGYRVSPTEIEEVGYATGLVRDAVALGVEDPGLGQRIVLIVTPARRAIWTPTALLDEMKARLPLYMVPSGVVVRDEHPALAERQVRPGAAARGVRVVSQADRSPRSAASTDNSAVGGMPSRPAHRARRLDAVLRLRPPTADRASRAAAGSTARATCTSATRSRRTRCRRSSSTSPGSSIPSTSRRRSRCGPRSTPRCRASRVSFAGPGKTEAEIVQAVAAGVTIEMESRTEAERVLRAGETLGVTPRVALRVNPDFQVKGSGMRMGGGPQQFGVDAEQVPALLAELAAADIDFLGFHVFAGSQNLNAEILCEAQRKTVELILALAEKAPGPVRYVNLGGGFGIPYFDKDKPLDLGTIGENLADLIANRIAPTLPEARGRHRTRPLHRRRVRGLRHPRGRPQGVPRAHLPRRRRRHAPPAGRLRQLRPGHPPQLPDRGRQPPGRGARRARRPSSAACAPRSTCSATTSPCRTPDIGDLIVLFQAGAYGLTASPTAFLGHPPPAEVLV